MRKRNLNVTAEELLVDQDTGLLPRPLAAALSVLVPEEIWLEGQVLRWRHTKGDGFAVPSERTFVEFLGLANSDDDAIRTYAIRWGVLGICQHGLPFAHNWSPSLPVYTPPPERLRENTMSYEHLCTLEGMRAWRVGVSEPLDLWRHFSRQALSLIKIASALRSNKNASAEDLQRVVEWAPEHNRRFWKGARPVLNLDAETRKKISKRELEWITEQWTLDRERHLVSIVVNEWLYLGAVAPAVSWAALVGTVRPGSLPRPSIRFDRQHWSYLFGFLACQLMFQIAGVRRLGVCENCGKPYVPSERLRKFCPDCRDSQASKLRMREKRARDRVTKHTNLTTELTTEPIRNRKKPVDTARTKLLETRVGKRQ